MVLPSVRQGADQILEGVAADHEVLELVKAGAGRGQDDNVTRLRQLHRLVDGTGKVVDGVNGQRLGIVARCLLCRRPDLGSGGTR